jgi:hypothetical protein
MAGSGSNTLRAVLKELGWARTRLVAELRRQAASSGDTLPGTKSLLAMVSRWVNNHQQPSNFYRDLLARTLGRPRAELFSDEAARLELAAEAEPWLLARALEASSVGQAALEALEQAVGEFARSYPSTAPTVLAAGCWNAPPRRRCGHRPTRRSGRGRRPLYIRRCEEHSWRRRRDHPLDVTQGGGRRAAGGRTWASAPPATATAADRPAATMGGPDAGGCR